jgi:hypothetical protein
MAETRAREVSTKRTSRLSAEAAQEIANQFLSMQVGDLLMAESPQLSNEGCWVMSITLGNTVHGMLGEVGTISVDARTGGVLFPEEERAKVAARADELSAPAAP